jgi:hypothetical protein
LPWRGPILCSAAFGPSSDSPPFSFCLSSAFEQSGGGGGTRRRQHARHGRRHLRLRPRPQPPGQDYQVRKEGGLVPENAVLSAELGAAPRAALLPAGRFAVPRGSHGGATGQSQRRSRRGQGCSPWGGVPPRAPTSLPLPPPPPTSPTYHFLCRDCARISGWSGGEGRGASSAKGCDEASDGGMDKATRAAIVRAHEVDQGGGGRGESGARKGGEGGATVGAGAGG